MSAPAQPRRLSERALEALGEALIAALAPDRVTAGEDDRRLHGTDESFHAPAPPDLVVFPLDVDEAAAVVRVCAEHRAPIVPFGAGTSLEATSRRCRAACPST
jgi:D-lactate dehydrogenase (cytochrome)